MSAQSPARVEKKRLKQPAGSSSRPNKVSTPGKTSVSGRARRPRTKAEHLTVESKDDWRVVAIIAGAVVLLVALAAFFGRGIKITL